jgi:hypothetical protein
MTKRRPLLVGGKRQRSSEQRYPDQPTPRLARWSRTRALYDERPGKNAEAVVANRPGHLVNGESLRLQEL